MSRIMPFALELRKTGAMKKERFLFHSRQALQAEMLNQQKQKPPFTGEMYPLIWDQGDWTIDSVSLDLLRATPQDIMMYRHLHLRQTGELLTLLSRQKEPLSSDQQQEIVDQVFTLYETLGIHLDEWMRHEDSPDPFLPSEEEVNHVLGPANVAHTLAYGQGKISDLPFEQAVDSQRRTFEGSEE